MRSLSNPARTWVALTLGAVTLTTLATIIVVTRSKTPLPSPPVQAPQAPFQEQAAKEVKPKPAVRSKAQGLGITPDELRAGFNSETRDSKIPYRIDRFATVEKNPNWFSYVFNDNVVLMGHLAEDNEHIASIMLLASPSSELQSVQAFLCMSALMTAITPDITPADRKEIVKNLGLLDSTKKQQARRTIFNGLKYYLQLGGMAKLTFGVELPEG